jgi:DtxR family transcriptional regulator, Mn-dependent transcriptional regulator
MDVATVSGFVGTGIALGLAALFWPGFGLLARRRVARGDERARLEDVLKHLYESEASQAPPSIQSVAGATQLRGDEAAEALQALEGRQLIRMEAGGFRLTAAGRELGLRVLRAHRLLESYLADHTGFPETEWHGRAHALEHGLSPAEVDALSARLQHPTYDPHGDPIPTAAGEFAGPHGVALTAAPLGRPLRIVHIEDEPPAVYVQLVVAGLYPGMVVKLSEASDQLVHLLAGGREQVLTPIVAASVAVEVLEPGQVVEHPAGLPLSALSPGESGRVLAVSMRCRGAERRRLMDLGILPGTVIAAEMRSPNGDPTAYRVRDALIALRAEQAELIQVERMAHDDTVH